jgi:hypothetical protein
MIFRRRRDEARCAAVMQGQVSAPERAGHLVECERCLRASLQAAVASRTPVGSPRAADPVVLWTRARQARRLQAEAQIARVLTMVQIAIGVIVVVPISLIVGLPTSWPTVAAVRELPWATIGMGLGLIALAGTGLAGLISQDA